MNNKLAFTMAEILISLTIVGVVAAITLPALQGNINEKVWNTQRKALYSRITQAISLMQSLNGYGLGEIQEDTNKNAAMAFVAEGLSKVLKINNICDNEHLTDCGIAAKYTNMAGITNNIPTKLSNFNSMFTETYVGSNGHIYQNSQKDIDTLAVAFETVNGENLLVLYNPQCVDDLGEIDLHFSQPKMCVNFIYDLNGTAGPNTIGKDMGFITALYPSNTNIVAPMPLATNASNSLEQAEAMSACRNQNAESRLPNRDELSAMFYNRDLLGITAGWFWSSSVVSDATAWRLAFSTGNRHVVPRSDKYNVRCIKR